MKKRDENVTPSKDVFENVNYAERQHLTEVTSTAQQTVVETAEEESLSDKVRIVSPFRLVMRRFFRSRLSILGLSILIVLLLFVFLGPLFAVWGETETDYSRGYNTVISAINFTDADGNTQTVYEVTIFEKDINKLAPCFSYSDEANGSRIHILGTDENGLDVFARLMYGGRISITLSIIVVIVNTLIGIILGALAGYIGKWMDQIVMRIVDIINCIPDLPLLLIISALLEGLAVPTNMRIYYLMGILALISWTGVARLVRGQILFLREQEYIVAADALGIPASKKIFKHLIPNVIPQLIVVMTLGLGSMILYEATLGYLGLGVPLPLASWGKMVNSATDPDILRGFANIWMPAGIVIILAVLAFNFVGDGLRDALDPKMKR